MKICISALFLQNHLGGIGWYCFSLIKHLKEKYPSLDITLVTHKGVAPQFYPLKDNIRLMEIGIKSRWLRIVYFQMIFPFLIKQKYHLLHSIGNIGMLACPIPQFITIHDTYEKVSPERFGVLKRTLMSFMISQSGKNAAGVIAVSKNTFVDISRFYPHLAGKTKTIYQGCRFPITTSSAPLRPEHFLFVGTIEPGKNLGTVLKALSIVNQTVKVDLTVIGAKGWKQSGIFNLVKHPEIADRVHFEGYVSEEQLKKDYRSSYALICASMYEGFGLPVIEALAFGCPVIAAKNSALLESGDSCVVYFETMDEKDLADKMLQVYTNAGSVRDNVQKGFIHAARFTWEKTACETYDFYMSSIYGGNGRYNGLCGKSGVRCQGDLPADD
ncbi:MAG: glycosyltransferase family 1 protein [Chitinivibrionales bacterium]